MATQKPSTASKRQTNDINSHHPKKPSTPQPKPAGSHAKTQRDQQTPASSSGPQPRAAASHTKAQREGTPRLAPRPSRRRRPTLGQRIARLSSGSWLAIITGVLLVGVIVFAIIASRASPTTVQSPTTGLLANGTTAPAIASLPAADGKSYSLAQYKGKVVVLEFFAPWCPHCQNETTVLKQIQAEYGSKGVQVLSVSASPYGRNYETQGDTTPISMSDIQWFSSNFGLNYPALFDPSLKAGTDYHIQGFPTTYLINKQGVITYAQSGEVNSAELQQQISAALNQ